MNKYKSYLAPNKKPFQNERVIYQNDAICALIVIIWR